MSVVELVFAVIGLGAVMAALVLAMTMAVTRKATERIMALEDEIKRLRSRLPWPAGDVRP
jgi:Tfp pilus assembly protein PilN